MALQLLRPVHRQFGKRLRLPSVLAANGSPGTQPQHLPEPRLHVFDRKSGTKFLVDSGSTVSLVPRHVSDSPVTRRKLKLTAANGTVIHTYGNRVMDLNLGLCRAFPWVFVIADVECAILGADFLAHFGLTVDRKSRRLADTQTTCYIKGIAQVAAVHGVAVASSQTPGSEALGSDFKELLKKFSSLRRHPLACAPQWPRHCQDAKRKIHLARTEERCFEVGTGVHSMPKS